MSEPGSNNEAGSLELSAVMRLDSELCTDDSIWLLVEVKPFGESLYMSVLRVERVLVIGRDPSCGIVLDGDLVSRRHALLHAVHGQGGMEVEDISRHGTMVNGLPLHAARAQVEREINLMIGCNRVRLRRLGSPNT